MFMFFTLFTLVCFHNYGQTIRCQLDFHYAVKGLTIEARFSFWNACTYTCTYMYMYFVQHLKLIVSPWHTQIHLEYVTVTVLDWCHKLMKTYAIGIMHYKCMLYGLFEVPQTFHFVSVKTKLYKSMTSSLLLCYILLHYLH